MAHYDPESDTLIPRLVDETNSNTKTTQQQYFNDILSVQRAFVASLRVVRWLPDTIDPDKPPRNYTDSMSRPDNQTIRNGQNHTRRNSKDSRTAEFLLRSGHPKELRSLGSPRVLMIKSIMVLWINERSACAFLGIINQKTASMLLIYIILFWKLQKLDNWQQSQQNMVARYWRLTVWHKARISVRRYGRRQGMYSTAWLVARAYSWRSCSLTSFS